MKSEVLQEVQDIVAKYALVPIRIYDFPSLKPLTRWSCGSFLHWLTDTVDFPDKFPESMSYLPNLSAFLRDTLHAKLRETVEKAQEAWKTNSWKIHSFSVLNDVRFYVVPVVKGNEETSVSYIALIGGFYIKKFPEPSSEIATGSDLSRWERRVLIEELNELQFFHKEEDAESKAKNIRGCLSAFVSYFADFKEPYEDLVANIYRFAEHREFWQKVSEKILTDLLKPEAVGVVISIYPFSEELKKKEVYGLGYATYYEEFDEKPGPQEKKPVYEIYIYTESNAEKYYLDLDLSVPPKEDYPWNDIKEWIEDRSIHKRVLALDLRTETRDENKKEKKSRKVGTLQIYFRKPQKTKRLKEFKGKMEWAAKFIASEIQGIKERTERFKYAMEFEFKEKTMELMKDLVAYTYIIERKDLLQLLGSFKSTFNFKKVEYYMPAFYKGDGYFEKIQIEPNGKGKSEFFEDLTLYNELFKKEKPYFERSNGEFYVPVSIEKKAIAVICGSFKPQVEQEKMQKLDMLLRLSTILAPKVMLRRWQETVSKISEEVGKKDFTTLFFASGRKMPRIDRAAELIARFFGAHAVIIWIYNDLKKKFELLGKAEEGFSEYFKSLKDKEVDVEELPFIKAAWENPHRIIRWPGDMNSSCCEADKTEYLHGFAISGAHRKEEMAVVVTLWTKLKGYTLTEEDKRTLVNLTDYLTGLINLKIQPIRESKVSDVTLTTFLHELLATISSLRHAVEFSTAIMDEDLEWAKKILTTDVETYFEYLRYLSRSLPWISRILRGEPIKFKTGSYERCEFWGEIVNKRVKRLFYATLKDKELKFEFDYDPQEFPEFIVLSEDELLALTMILYNLIGNAIKYSCSETTIKVRGEVRQKFIHIYVENFGIGVPEGEEEKIFEKGMRGSNVSTSRAGGTGLGLFIARKLAQSLGGDIQLIRNADPTVFLFKIPIKYFHLWKGGKLL